LAVDHPAARQVVRGELESHTVARQDPDPVALEASTGVPERLVAVVETDTEHATAERFRDLTLEFDLLLFLLLHPNLPVVARGTGPKAPPLAVPRRGV